MSEPIEGGETQRLGDGPAVTGQPVRSLDESAPRLRLPWRQRLQNRLRLAVCNWFGITFALQQLNLRNGGCRMDIDALAKAAQHNAELLKQVAQQLNRNTALLNAFQQYPMLGKIAAEWRATQTIQQAKKNGTGPTILDMQGRRLGAPEGSEGEGQAPE